MLIAWDALRLKTVLSNDMDNNNPEDTPGRYTCNEYRAEMILLALQNKMQQPNLSEEERRKVLQEIARLETIVGLT